MVEIPTINWRPAGVYYITDFVQIENPVIQETFQTLNGKDDDQFVKSVAEHIRDDFIYPLSSITKNPAPEMQILHGSKSPGAWHFKRCIPYSWLFPTEVEGSTKEGICVDTTNLALSLLRCRKLKAWAVLGTVNRTSDGELLGYHAWIEVQHLGSTYVLETTVHGESKNNLIPADAIYNKKLDIYYVPTARYNERTYKEKGGSAINFVKFMGTDGGNDHKHWKKQEKVKQYAIWANFNDVVV